jgi:agmatine/peptidylarginine deiminase
LLVACLSAGSSGNDSDASSSLKIDLRLGAQLKLSSLKGCRLPAEFERQGALLIACRELTTTAPGLIAEFARATRGRVEVIALVTCVQEHEAIMQLLRSQRISHRHLHFVEVSHDTMWTRDFGPIVVEARNGSPMLVDAEYDASRGNDDIVPMHLAHLLNLNRVELPLRIDGGNLLSNGRGLVLTTHRLADENTGQADLDEIYDAIGHNFGAQQVVILEPLAGESTGHVDMFASFTSANTVVVGQYDPALDPENAAILDRNAQHLAQVSTAQGKLRVVRIPMPPHNDDIWRTYTNVVFANGALLVPTYADADWGQQRQVLATYARLLPGWRILGVNADEIIGSQGALHCITMNLGPLNGLPRFPRPHTTAAPRQDAISEAMVTLAEETSFIKITIAEFTDVDIEPPNERIN